MTDNELKVYISKMVSVLDNKNVIPKERKQVSVFYSDITTKHKKPIGIVYSGNVVMFNSNLSTSSVLCDFIFPFLETSTGIKGTALISNIVDITGSKQIERVTYRYGSYILNRDDSFKGFNFKQMVSLMSKVFKIYSVFVYFIFDEEV